MKKVVAKSYLPQTVSSFMKIQRLSLKNGNE